MYDDMRQTAHWLSPTGRQAFYRIDAYQQQLDVRFFMRHVLRFVHFYPNVFRLNISLGFVLINQAGQLDVFRSGQNNTHITAQPYLYLHPTNMSASLDMIEHALVDAERHDFRNKKQEENARESGTSVVLPLYVLITGLLFRGWRR